MENIETACSLLISTDCKYIIYTFVYTCLHVLMYCGQQLSILQLITHWLDEKMAKLFKDISIS